MKIKSIVAYFMFMCALRTGAEEVAPAVAEGAKGAEELSAVDAAAGIGAGGEALAGSGVAGTGGFWETVGSGEGATTQWNPGTTAGPVGADPVAAINDAPAGSITKGVTADDPFLGGFLGGTTAGTVGAGGVGDGGTSAGVGAEALPGDSIAASVGADTGIGSEVGAGVGVDAMSGDSIAASVGAESELGSGVGGVGGDIGTGGGESAGVGVNALSGDSIAASLGADASMDGAAGGIFSGGSGGGGGTIGEDVATGSGASTAETVAAEKAFTEGAKGAGGVQSALDKLLKYGPLALSAGNLLNQRSAINKFAGAGANGTPATLSQIGAPQTAVGQRLLADFQNGTLNPADSAAIDRWEQQALAQMKQFYANAHISDSSQATSAAADISKKATEMRAQARQNLLTTGLSALNVTDGNQRAAIQAEMSADAAARAASLKFMDSYGAWLANLPKLTGASAPASESAPV